MQRTRSCVIIVENLAVPLDRRVWQEARALSRAIPQLSPTRLKETKRSRGDAAIYANEPNFGGLARACLRLMLDDALRLVSSWENEAKKYVAAVERASRRWLEAVDQSSASSWAPVAVRIPRR
jgi:hypothetical protein